MADFLISDLKFEISDLKNQNQHQIQKNKTQEKEFLPKKDADNTDRTGFLIGVIRVYLYLCLFVAKGYCGLLTARGQSSFLSNGVTDMDQNCSAGRLDIWFVDTLLDSD